MPIEVSKLTREQYNEILNKQESHFCDLKAVDITPGKLSKTISAFANADGGELYIGIDERTLGTQQIRSWRGFTDQESANAHIQLFQELFPLGENYSFTFLESDGSNGLVLQVTINKSREIVKASDNTPYKRVGAQSLPVKNERDLERLKLDKGIESFERKTIDVDKDLLTQSEVIALFITSIIPSADPFTWLKKQQLFTHDKPTVAGVLLFTDEPQAILPKRCGIKIYRYATTEAEGTRDTLVHDPMTIEGCLYVQIKQAVAKTIEIVEEIPKMGKEGFESICYPSEAIHEIITNAVLHRDYSIATDIQVRIFDNRIEIESPGKLPGHITQDNILREQYARNPSIIRIINKFPNPPNKDVGEGLNTAFQAMAKLRLKPPEIFESETSVKVYIRHESLASIEVTIIDYLDQYGQITNQIARQETGIKSEATIKEAFYRLKNKGLIELIPGRPKKQAAWRKIRDKNNLGNDLPTLYDLYPQFEEQVIEYLEKNEEINNATARKITGIESANTMNNIFDRLKRKKIIETVPGRRGVKSAWRKCQY